MAFKFKENPMGLNSRNRVKELMLTLLVYAFFFSLFVFADKSTELWDSDVVSASLAVAFTVISMMQILIFMRVSAFSKKTNRMIREIQGLRTNYDSTQLQRLSTSDEIQVSIEALRLENSSISEEILINIEALRSVLNALNLQNLDEQNPQLKAAP